MCKKENVIGHDFTRENVEFLNKILGPIFIKISKKRKDRWRSKRKQRIKLSKHMMKDEYYPIFKNIHYNRSCAEQVKELFIIINKGLRQ